MTPSTHSPACQASCAPPALGGPDTLETVEDFQRALDYLESETIDRGQSEIRWLSEELFCESGDGSGDGYGSDNLPPLEHCLKRLASAAGYMHRALRDIARLRAFLAKTPAPHPASESLDQCTAPAPEVPS